MYIFSNIPFNFTFKLFQVGKRREHTRTTGMYAPVTCSSANRADFYQLDGDIGQQETGVKKYQWSCKAWTSFGRNGAFR